MSELKRRDLLAGLAAFGIVGANAAEAQSGSLGASKVFVPELTKQASGAEHSNILRGTLSTGEAIAMHESIVPAGTPGAALHRIDHSELIVLVEGTVAFQHDGAIESVTAGSIIYIARGTEHAVKNIGDGPARYFVWQMGGDTK